MKIGVISDIHGIFPVQFKNFLKDTDEIWCLGDIWTQEVYEEILALNIPVVAVSGNWEEEQVSPLYKELKNVEHLEREGLHIMLSHKNWGYENHYNDKGGVDLHCYGHIHSFSFETKWKRKDGKPTFCLNPGAVTPLYEKTASAVTLEIKDGQIFNCRRLAINCNAVSDGKTMYYGVFNNIPPEPWLYCMYAPSYYIGLMDNEDESYEEWKDLISNHLLYGKAEGKYIANVFNEDTGREYAGAFVDYDESAGVISFNGYAQIVKGSASPGLMCYYIEEMIKQSFKKKQSRI